MWAQAYAFPKFHFDLHLCKSNRPPHTAVRGPGEIQATMLAEHLIEHVAARLRMDPILVRERNFIKHDGEPDPIFACSHMPLYRESSDIDSRLSAGCLCEWLLSHTSVQ